MRDINKMIVLHNRTTIAKFDKKIINGKVSLGDEIEIMNEVYLVRIIDSISYETNTLLHVETEEELFERSFPLDGLTIKKLKYHLKCLGYDLVKSK